MNGTGLVAGPSRLPFPLFTSLFKSIQLEGYLFETVARPFPISGRKESLVPGVPRSRGTMRTGIIILQPYMGKTGC